MDEIQQPPVAAKTEHTNRVETWLKSAAAARVADLLIAAMVIVLIFRKLQFSTGAVCCGDFDGYYHIKWARLLWEGIRAKHFPPRFIWLPLTTLNPHNYVDHHLLFHLLLIPFTWFRDLQTGAKIAAIVFGSFAVWSCYWLVVRYRIRYSLIWLLALLASSSPFLYRMNMTKAPPLAIVFLIVGIYLFFERKCWPLLPLAFVFALTYDMFVLLGVAVAIWVAVIGWTEERFEWRPLAYVCLGLALGLVINPYFPHNLYLLYEHARLKIMAGNFSTKVGQEWYPYDTQVFLGSCLVALAAMMMGYIAFDGRDRKRSQRSLFLLVFSTALMVMTALWKRFAEYFPPFAILFVAFTLEQFWADVSVFTHLPDDILEDLQPFLDRQEPQHLAADLRREQTWRVIKVGLVVVVLGAALFLNIRETAKEIAESNPREYYAHGAAWMHANIPPGETVFNTDWDDFPRLFYYDPTHVYVSGLDPSYLLDQNAELSELYDRITLGDQEDPGPLIRDRFGARWVFSDNTKDHDAFYDQALRSGWFDRVYEDSDCSVLHLRDQKGEPPPEEKNNDSDKDNDKDKGNDKGNDNDNGGDEEDNGP